MWLVVLGAVSTLLYAPGGQEMSTWQRWMSLALEIDPVYAFHADPNAYPPGAVSLLFIAGTALPGNDPQQVIKLLLLMASVLISVAAGFWLRSWPVAWTTLAVTGFVGAGLGLLDVLYLLPLTLAFWALSRERFAVFSFFFATAVMIKWQPAILAPVLLVYLIKQGRSRPHHAARMRMAAATLLPALAVIGVTVAVFGWPYMRGSLMGATQQDMLSGNALNLNWLLSAVALGPDEGWGTVHYMYVAEAPTWMPWMSKTLFILAYVGLIWLCAKVPLSFDGLMVAALAAVVLYGMLAVGAHENHMMLVVPAALFVMASVPELRVEAILALSLPVVNTLWFTGPTGTRIEPVLLGSLDASIVGALIFVIASVYLVARSIRFLAGRPDA